MEFIVKGQMMTRIDDEVLVSHAVGYPTVKFTFFSSEWDNISKTALFRRTDSDTGYKVSLSSDGTCIMPAEVLSYGAGELMVSVYGGNRITTNIVIVRIMYGGYVEGIEPSEPIFGYEISTVNELMTYIGN